ncbi:hypothetical protein [Taklimakanibacter lacteus]|uniref:hypothetical protein n=1 Tax=Taklimakanibacter lacteus TaxID=2268456 RepID=UPI000E67335A
MMLTPLKPEVLKVDDLSHEARRFRTIVWSFQRNLDLLFKGTGLTAKVDHAALAEAFARWRQKFDQSKHLADVNRNDYVIYAAGLMLRELIVAAPLKASQGEELPTLPGGIDHPLARWPEGYAYTSFCLSVAAAILKELGDDEPTPAEVTDDPGFWNSFRENTHEDPETAVGFFDLVCGREPNWAAPGVLWLRKAFAQHGKLLDDKV